MSLRDYLARLAYEHRARDAWFGEWHAHPLAISTDTAVDRASRRTMVLALSAEMSARFSRKPSGYVQFGRESTWGTRPKEGGAS